MNLRNKVWNQTWNQVWGQVCDQVILEVSNYIKYKPLVRIMYNLQDQLSWNKLVWIQLQNTERDL